MGDGAPDDLLIAGNKWFRDASHATLRHTIALLVEENFLARCLEPPSGIFHSGAQDGVSAFQRLVDIGLDALRRSQSRLSRLIRQEKPSNESYAFYLIGFCEREGMQYDDVLALALTSEVGDTRAPMPKALTSFLFSSGIANFIRYPLKGMGPWSMSSQDASQIAAAAFGELTDIHSALETSDVKEVQWCRLTVSNCLNDMLELLLDSTISLISHTSIRPDNCRSEACTLASQVLSGGPLLAYRVSQYVRAGHFDTLQLAFQKLLDIKWHLNQDERQRIIYKVQSLKKLRFPTDNDAAMLSQMIDRFIELFNYQKETICVAAPKLLPRSNVAAITITKALDTRRLVQELLKGQQPDLLARLTDV